MKATSKKLVRPTSRTPQEDADPVGLFPALYAKLKAAYHAQLRAFLRRNLLVGGLEPAVLRRIVAASTIQEAPVSFDLRITVHPRDARGFAPVVGTLMTPPAQLSDEHSPDPPPDDPGEGRYLHGLFGARIPMSLVKTRRRRFGRRR
jgi:hypothetical protein